jgi:hypothetical protein
VPDESTVYEREGRIVLVVNGYHDEDAARRCTSAIAEFAGDRTDAELVVDITHISGFTSDARRVWAERMRDVSRCVRTMTVVGGTPLARMTGAAVCLYAGIKMRSAATLKEAFALPLTRAS